jgi:hypothetical protein
VSVRAQTTLEPTWLLLLLLLLLHSAANTHAPTPCNTTRPTTLTHLDVVPARKVCSGGQHGPRARIGDELHQLLPRGLIQKLKVLAQHTRLGGVQHHALKLQVSTVCGWGVRVGATTAKAAAAAGGGCAVGWCFVHKNSSDGTPNKPTP